MSIPKAAFEAERRERAAWNDYLLSAYQRAELATNANMLNSRGRKAQFNSLDLFKANWVTQNAYASEELKEHWQAHPIIRWSVWADAAALYITALGE